MRAAALGLLLLLAAPGLVRAESALDGPRKLAASGKLDEAEKALDAAQPGLAGEEARSARRLRAEIAGRRPEKAAFEKARALYQELAREDENDLESRFALYELLWERGRRLVLASRKVEDGSAYKAEARETFNEGAKLLEAEWKSLEGKDTETAEKALVVCGFFWPRCIAGSARLDNDHALLEKAVSVWMSYSERFGMYPEGYEAAVDLAEALVELGRLDEALGAVESGIAIDDGGAAPEWTREVFGRASLLKTRILLRKRDAKNALLVAERAIKRLEASPDQAALHAALRLERANAWARDGKTKEALADLERLVAGDPNGAMGDAARETIARITGSVAGAVSSERALKSMNEALDREQPGTALAYGRSALLAARAEGKKESELAALEGIGRSLEVQRRLLEARIAFEEVAAATKAPSDLAARAALGAVRCAEVERARAPGTHANAVCERALALLERRDPEAKNGIAPFLLAKQLQEQARYAEAARSYDAVAPRAGELHDEALYAGACCRYLDAKGDKTALAEVEKHLLALLARPKRPIQERGKLLLADVLLQTDRPEGVGALLGDMGEPGLQLRALAHVRLGELDRAEPLVATLLAAGPPDRRTANACRELALALARKSAALPDGERRAARARLARYFAAWLEEATPAQALTIAQETFVLGLDVLGLSEKGAFVVELDGEPSPEAAPLLAVAVKAFDQVLAGPRSTERWKLLACRAQALAFTGQWREAVDGFTALAAETKLFSPEGELAREVLAKNPLLVGYLADLGACELRKGATEEGRKHLALVLGTAREASRLWWLARLAVLADDDRRGTKDALADLQVALRALSRKYPDFAGAKELAPRLLDLAKKYGVSVR